MVAAAEGTSGDDDGEGGGGMGGHGLRAPLLALVLGLVLTVASVPAGRVGVPPTGLPVAEASGAATDDDWGDIDGLEGDVDALLDDTGGSPDGLLEDDPFAADDDAAVGIDEKVLLRPTGFSEGANGVDGCGQRLVWVAPGRFYMGSSSDGLSAVPVIPVEIDRGFWIGSTEVTQEAFEAVVGRNPSRIRGPRLPVESVSWDEARIFCDLLTEREGRAGRLPAGFRYALPSEAQWEFAARAGTMGRRYASPLDEVAWFEAQSGGVPHEVEGLAPNDWGLHDTLGNVAEWCADSWSDDHEGASASGESRSVPGERRHVVRGGSYASEAAECRSAVRVGCAEPSPTLGFRVAVVPRPAVSVPTVAAPRPGRPWANGLGLRLVWIEPGEFYMGSSSGESDEWPVHQASVLEGFWMGACEVTQAEYEAVVGSNPSFFHGSTLPVDTVSWVDATAFCERLTARERAAGTLPQGYRYTLPTEVQWEYACRAGTMGKRYDGPLRSLAWYADTSEWRTRPVGSLTPNEWGLHDMLGNVWEWCLDGWTESYDDASAAPDAVDLPIPDDDVGDLDDDPDGLGPETPGDDRILEELGGGGDSPFSQDSLARDERLLRELGGDTGVEASWVATGPAFGVLRGGSWYSDSWQCRSANRKQRDRATGFRNIGFRVVLTADEGTDPLVPSVVTGEPSSDPFAPDPFGADPFDDEDDDPAMEPVPTAPPADAPAVDGFDDEDDFDEDELDL